MFASSGKPFWTLRRVMRILSPDARSYPSGVYLLQWIMRTTLLLCALPLALACSDDPVGVGPPVTVSGTISVQNGATVPANARIVILWGVSSGSSDYAYVWGTGTVSSTGAWSVTLPTEPPAAALNDGRLGVGLVLLTTDQGLADGQVPDNYAWPGLLGMSEDHSVVFTKNVSAAMAADWPGRFDGFGVGLVQRSTTSFDSFTRVGLGDIVIVVDDLANLNPPNWT